jgi:oxaloacetate decarboxylase alpha subunit
VIDDVLTYALFPQVGLRFLENRDNPEAFEPPPGQQAEESEPAEAVPPAAPAPPAGPVTYSVKVDGRAYTVEVAESGTVGRMSPETPGAAAARSAERGEAVRAALAGTVFKLLVKEGEHVESGQAVLILEAMKMETEISAHRSGTVTAIHVAVGDAVAVGDPLLSVG